MWVFHGISNQDSHYKSSTKYEILKFYLSLQDPTNTSTILASKNYLIPMKINHINAWSKDVNKLI